MNETDFIAALRNLPLHPGARGIEDDCAVLEFGGETLVITHDMMAEGTHWLPDQDMADVAWKLVATNLSDLAAKGAEPIGVLLGHSLGKGDERFIEGLNEVLIKYDVPLLGGDTIAADGPQTLGLTALGRASHTPVPSRSGAKVGDDVFLCGEIGNAFLGYQLTKYEECGFDADPLFLDAFLRPTPLLEQGQRLAPHVTAIMDVSDGLFLDASRLAHASTVTLNLVQDDVPHSEQFIEVARQGNQLDVMSNGWPMRKTACSWGDDYALLFTAPADAKLPVAATRIGSVTARGEHALLIDGKPADEAQPLGYQHG